MNNFTKNLGRAIIAASVLVGGAASVEHMPAAHAAETPYYTYTGYTGGQAKFVLDSHFVAALKHHTFKLNGYSVHKNAAVASQDAYFEVKDAVISKDAKKRVSSISFPVKKGVVKKSVFLKAHQTNVLLDKGAKNKDGSSVAAFKTDSGKYFAIFDSKGYLERIEINSNK